AIAGCLQQTQTMRDRNCPHQIGNEYNAACENAENRQILFSVVLADVDPEVGDPRTYLGLRQKWFNPHDFCLQPRLRSSSTNTETATRGVLHRRRSCGRRE